MFPPGPSPCLQLLRSCPSLPPKDSRPSRDALGGEGHHCPKVLGRGVACSPIQLVSSCTS